MKITGRGVIEKGRKPNTWYVTHYLGEKDERGRYKRAPRRLVHGKKSEAYRALEEYRAELESGLPVAPAKATVGQYAKKFHDDRVLDSPLSYKREELEIRHIGELFGDVPLTKLTAADIRSRYALERRRRDAGQTAMSEDTLYKTHVKLRQVLKQACVDELIRVDPAELVEFHRPKPKERKSLTLEEAQRLHDCIVRDIDDEPSGRLVGLLLLLCTGVRRGEALGLHWRNVDLTTNEIRIVEQYAADKTIRPPKSEESRRRLHIDSEFGEVLAKWKRSQASMLGIRDEASQDDVPVVTSETGGLIDPSNYYRWFQRYCVRNGFGRWVDDEGNEVSSRDNANGFPVDADGRPYSRSNRRPKRHYQGLQIHQIRHTQATLLIANNADWKTVQHRIGHAQASTTMNIYAHAVESNDIAAAETIGGLLSSKKRG